MPDERQRPRTLILPPAPYAAALFGGWWLDRRWQPLPWDDGVVSGLLGWVWLGVGLALFGWTLWTFHRHRTTVNPYAAASVLCTDGPFRYTRNPIYLGDWFILVGVALILNTVWPLLFAPLVWAMLRYGVIRHEEAHLEAKFGETYRVYKAKVRRWV
ncbi:MAG: methyltransferase family protein [Thiobacillus sp.]